MNGPVGIGVIGAGTISDTYLENLTSFADTDVLALGDIVPEAARLKAAKYDVAAAGDVDTVLDHPGVEVAKATAELDLLPVDGDGAVGRLDTAHTLREVPFIDREKPFHVGVRKLDRSARPLRLRQVDVVAPYFAEEPEEQVEEVDADVRHHPARLRLVSLPGVAVPGAAGGDVGHAYAVAA